MAKVTYIYWSLAFKRTCSFCPHLLRTLYGRSLVCTVYHIEKPIGGRETTFNRNEHIPLRLPTLTRQQSVLLPDLGKRAPEPPGHIPMIARSRTVQLSIRNKWKVNIFSGPQSFEVAYVESKLK